MTERHWLLYDGDCGMCRRTVNWIGRRDKDGQFEIIEFQIAPTPPMTPEIYEACKKAMHVVTGDGTIIKAGRSMMYVLKTINGGYGILPRFLSLPPMIWFVELGYIIVAANRQFFSRFIFNRDEQGELQKHCRLPQKDDRGDAKLTNI